MGMLHLLELYLGGTDIVNRPEYTLAYHSTLDG